MTVLVEKEDIQDICDCVKADQVIAFPTETVFGLGVRFGSYQALEKLYQIKNRKKTKAITLMLADTKDIEQFAYLNDIAKKIIQCFMPGEITLVCKKKETVDKVFTSNKDTIGIRVPKEPFVQSLLQITGPMLVTSANLSGKDNLYHDSQVYQEFNQKIPVIVKGQTKGTVASTVIDVSNEKVEILREGIITEEKIKEAIYENCNS